jgi:hypothetical protein
MAQAQTNKQTNKPTNKQTNKQTTEQKYATKQQHMLGHRGGILDDQTS